MRLFILMLKNNFLRQWSYRINFIGTIGIGFMFYFGQFIFIKQILSFNNSIAGYQEQDLYFIYVIFGCLFLLISFISHSINRFFEIVYLGEIEPYLVKPGSLISLIILRWCSPLHIFLAVILLIFIALSGYLVDLPVSGMNWVGLIIALIAVVVANLAFILGLNCLTFVVKRKLPIDYIHERIFDLSIVPTALFPKTIFRWLVVALPIAVSASLPAEIFLKSHFNLLSYLILAALCLCGITTILFRYTFKHFVSLGG